MKLASLREGGRDGTLIVVNRALTEAVKATDVATTMQAAIEDWDTISPQLNMLFDQLEAGHCPAAFPLVVDDLASPFPRAYQFLDGSVYLHHMKKARAARGAAMPPNYETEPLMYQGMSHAFCDPTGPMHYPTDELLVDFEGEVVIVTDDVPMGVTPQEAGHHIKLLMLLNDFTARAKTKSELPKQFGFLQAKPTSSCSPVAITLDELEERWDGHMPDIDVTSKINHTWFGSPNAARDYWFDYPTLIAHAAATRELCAGTLIGVSVEALDGDGHSIFGAIINEIAPYRK